MTRFTMPARLGACRYSTVLMKYLIIEGRLLHLRRLVMMLITIGRDARTRYVIEVGASEIEIVSNAKTIMDEFGVSIDDVDEFLDVIIESAQFQWEYGFLPRG